jgi:hypothetical protein
MKRTMFCILAVIFAAAAATVAQQQEEKKASGDASKRAAAPAAPLPSPEMEKLIRALSGTWAIKATYEATDGVPPGATDRGRAVYRPGPGSLVLIEEYRSHGAGGNYSGLGVIWWDDNAHSYRTTWCDNQTRSGCRFLDGKASPQGSNFVFEDVVEVQGKKQAVRETYQDITSASFTQVLEAQQADGSWKRTVTVKNTKLAR